MSKFSVCGFFILLLLNLGEGSVKLGSYNVDPSQITVSGLSAGGAMAMQFHFAYSTEVHGAGIFAGLPYTCAKGSLTEATLCMTVPNLATPISAMVNEANKLSDQGKIDNISNLNGHKAFIWHGTSDYTVFLANSDNIKAVYDSFGVSVSLNNNMNANHGHPTSHYGTACSIVSAGTQYINNCNYKGSYIMLNYLYGGGLVEPSDYSGNLPGDFFEFDQSEFFSGEISFDNVGFAYVPSNCKDKLTPCRFHIAFHGCLQSRSHVGDIYATKTGYLQAAELNNIITIFPQAKSLGFTQNPNACFEWWPYINTDFTNKNGVQMKAVYGMLNRVVHEFDGEDPPPTTTTTQTPSTELPDCPCEAVYE